MGKVFLQGAVLFIAGVVCLFLNQVLNLGLGSLVFGIAIGGILGLVSDGGPIGRAGAFLIGIVVAIVTYLVRVLFLNDSFAGNVILLILAFLIITVICALTSGRLPLWAALAGVALVTGAYETAFVDAPQNVQTELFQHLTMALVPAAFAFLATMLLPRTAPAEPPGRQYEQPNAPMAPSGAATTNSEV